MNKLETINKVFEGHEIRSIWNEKKQDYYFSVVDIIAVLTNTKIPRNYWSDLKRKLIIEGSEVHEKIVQLKLVSKDGKRRLTDTLDTKGIKKESLRDNMTDIEIILTDFGEIATRDIAINEKPQGLKENIEVAKRGGSISKTTKELYEKETTIKLN